MNFRQDKHFKNKLNLITFVNKENQKRYIKYNPFWNSWTFSLITSAGAFCIWAVLFILLNVLWQIELTSFTPTPPGHLGWLPTDTIWLGEVIFATTDYPIWISAGKILAWIIFAFGLVALVLAFWQLYNSITFKNNIRNLIIDGYIPSSSYEKNVISSVIGIFNYDDTEIDESLIVGYTKTNLIKGSSSNEIGKTDKGVLKGTSSNNLENKTKINKNVKENENDK